MIKKKKKKKKKNDKPEKRELKEEEKLNKPEGAISLEDYLKSKETIKEEEKEVKRVQEGKPLEKVVKKDTDELGTTGAGRKKNKKKKEKDVNKEEENLNKEISSGLKIDNDTAAREKGNFRGGRGGSVSQRSRPKKARIRRIHRIFSILCFVNEEPIWGINSWMCR